MREGGRHRLSSGVADPSAPKGLLSAQSAGLTVAGGRLTNSQTISAQPRPRVFCRRASRSGERQGGPVRTCGLCYDLGAEVLRDLTFRVDPRSFQFITGPSGAGKTSLLRLLFLSLRPTRGLVTLFGHDITTLSKDALATLRRRIGIVFQDFRLLDHMTTFENVALPLRVIGQAEDSYREEVVELLIWVGLGDRISALPPVLSGGEK